jgi:hypothetical protein
LLPYLTIETVPTDPPVFGKNAAKCQAAIAKQGLGFAKKVQGELGKCLNTVLGAVAKGVAPSTVADKCAQGLDDGDPKSILAKARASAASSIAKSCGGTAPADIHAPCDAGATTIAATASCVLGDHRRRAEQMIAAEYADACTILRSVGFDGSFPEVCAP